MTVELPDSSDTVTNGKDVVLPAGENSPIVALDDSSVTVNSEPTSHVGDIIVSDIAPNAPQGLLRWVDSIDRIGDLWVIGTHQASLTDEFYQVKIDGNSVNGSGIGVNPDDAPNESTVNVPTSESLQGKEVVESSDISVTGGNVSNLSDANGNQEIADRQLGIDDRMTHFSTQTAEVNNAVGARPQTAPVSQTTDWVEDTDRDARIYLGKHSPSIDFKACGGDCSQAKHAQTTYVRAEGTAKIALNASIDENLIAGIDVRAEWVGFIPRARLDYFRIGLEFEYSFDASIAAAAKFETRVPLTVLKKSVTIFVGVVPVVITAGSELAMSFELEGAVSYQFATLKAGRVQVGFMLGQSYSNAAAADISANDGCTVSGIGKSLSFSAGPEITPSFFLYESLGISGTVQLFLVSVFTQSAGTTTVASSLDVAFNVQLKFTIPIVGEEISATPELTLAKVSYPISKAVISDSAACKGLVAEVDESATSSTPSSGSGSVLGDGMVKVTWRDSKTGASKTGQLVKGSFFTVSQEAVAAQMGITAGSLAGMKGVTVHTTLMDYSVANGHSFQAPDDSIIVETYYDDPATEVVDGTADADVAFVIDTTGSMWDEIADVKNNVEALTNTIHADSPTTRIAYLTYSDCYYANSGVRLVVPFTTDPDTVITGIKNAPFDDGGLEAVYSGLSQAADMDWRQNVKKSIILVGDEPATDPEPNGLTFDTTVAKLKSKDIQVYATGEVSHYSTASSSGAASAGTVADRTASDDAVAFSAAHAAGSENPLAFALAAAQSVPAHDVALDNGGTAAALTVVDGAASADGSYGAQAVNDWGYDWTKFATELSEATGGHFVEYTRDDFVNRLTETVVDAVKRPDVNVELGHSVYTGDQADFTATAVTHQENAPVVSYGWDFGNGQTMTTAPGATASTAYAADGTYSVIVKAVTQSGLVGSTVYQLTVGAHQAPYMYNAHKVVSRSASGVSPVRLDVLNDPGEEFASVAFSNGSDTIAVPGEGAWTIGWDAESGLLEATFTPESGFAGGVTSRVPYTVTNSGGLSGTGELWVRYVS